MTSGSLAQTATHKRRFTKRATPFVLLLLFLGAGLHSPAANYSDVDSILSQYCLDCHAGKDAEGELVLEDYQSLMKGGSLGPVLVPGKSSASLLVQMVEGSFEKDGKKKIMPPAKRKKLSAAEIATLRAWIDGGALAPATLVRKELVVPNIQPLGEPRNPVVSLAFSPAAKLVAAGRYGRVELRAQADMAPVRVLPGIRGNVNALVFSADGARLFAAAGQPGVSGEVRQWRVADGEALGVLEAHKDAIYSLALSPDGKLIATGSYDQKIKLWDVETFKELRTLSGHNGCIYDLAFRPDGKLLASASADRTVKLWDPATGERRDTLSQSLKEVFTVAFSPDGNRLVGGGADNRLRIWRVSETAAETTNPLLDAKFAHEGAILRLVFSADGKMLLSAADDRTVKVWDAEGMKELLLLNKQPDWTPALAFLDAHRIVAGRLDGTIGIFDVGTGKELGLANR